MTYVQRIVAIANALVNGTATAAQIRAVADAYVDRMGDDQIQSLFGVPIAQLTDEQRAHVYVQTILDEARVALRYKAEKDAQTAASAAIKAAGDAATGGL